MKKKKHTREMTLNSSIIKKNAHFSSENYYQLILSNASMVLSISCNYNFFFIVLDLIN